MAFTSKPKIHMAKSDIILADALAELVVEYKLAFTNFTLNDQFTLNLYKRCHEVPLQQHLTMQKAPVLVQIETTPTSLESHSRRDGK